MNSLEQQPFPQKDQEHEKKHSSIDVRDGLIIKQDKYGEMLLDEDGNPNSRHFQKIEKRDDLIIATDEKFGEIMLDNNGQVISSFCDKIEVRDGVIIGVMKQGDWEVILNKDGSMASKIMDKIQIKEGKIIGTRKILGTKYLKDELIIPTTEKNNS